MILGNDSLHDTSQPAVHLSTIELGHISSFPCIKSNPQTRHPNSFPFYRELCGHSRIISAQSRTASFTTVVMAKHQQQIDIYYHLSDVSSFKIPEEMRPHRNSAARFIQSIAGPSNSTRALSALSTGPPHRTATRSLSTGQAECWPLWALKELEGDKNKTKLWKPPSTCSRCRCHTLRPPRK